MALDKECKGSNRYAVKGPEAEKAPVTNVYVSKAFCGNAQAIRVTVEAP